jgi:hypothetical protein
MAILFIMESSLSGSMAAADMKHCGNIVKRNL